MFSSKKLIANTIMSNVVYGGLLLAQSVAAAEQTVSTDMKMHSVHSHFLLSGKINFLLCKNLKEKTFLSLLSVTLLILAVPDEPINYRVLTIRNGRSFSARTVHAEQKGEIVKSCQISFHKVTNTFFCINI